MRVISGKYGGRRLSEFKGREIRPTSDRAKEALFNILSKKVAGANVLDLFCGSGNLGIEALSRGAQLAVFVDNDKNSLKICAENLKVLNEKAKTIFTDAEQFLCGACGSYRLIFIDPPYALKDKAVKCLELIVKNRVLDQEGVAVIESDAPFGEIKGLQIVDSRKYGVAHFTFYAPAPVV